MAPQDQAYSDAEKLDMICSYMRNEFCWGISDFITALAHRKAVSATITHEQHKTLESFANQINVTSIFESLIIEKPSPELVPPDDAEVDSESIVDQPETNRILLSYYDSPTPTFKYEPIGIEGPAFRLLRLLKGIDDSIQGQLFESGLALQENYTALSYTWGGESRPCEILINGRKMAVTKNAYLALRDLRYQEKDRLVWIDALCIDQDNKEERGHQVQQMGSIYNNAERVAIWLGEANYDTDFIMHHMKRLQESVKHAPNDHKISDIWSTTIRHLSIEQRSILIEGFQTLLRRDWFKRVWIIQETAKAQEAEIICGNKSVSASIFAHMPSLLEVTPEPHCQPVLDVMPGPLRKTSWWAEKQDLFTLLVKFCNSKATEPRDSIYALLGISSDAYDTDLLKADYEKEVKNVIFDTISFLLDFKKLEFPTGRFFDWTLPKLWENLNVLANEVLKHAVDNELLMVVTLLIVRDDVDVNLNLGYQKSNPQINHDFHKWTPLFWAAQNGHDAVVKLLLERDAEIEIQTSDGYTPLLVAAEKGHEVVVRLLLEKAAELETRIFVHDQTPLVMAALNGHNLVVKLLLEKGAELEAKDIYGYTPLLWAAEEGHEAVVKLLLERKAKLEVKQNSGCTPLLLATRNGHEAVVELLLEKGAEPETKEHSGYTPLSVAAKNGHEAVVKLLLDKGAELEVNVFAHGQTPLLLAARNGHEAVVTLLLEKGANSEAKDSFHGRTPLSWAVKNGHEVVVTLLLEKGAKLKTKDFNNSTPLSWAIDNGHGAIVKLLVEKGAKLEAEDLGGNTPLSWAAENGHEAVVKLLLEKGVDLDAKDRSYGQTPLLWAVRNGHEAVVNLLLKKGANSEAKDPYGKTPLLWAVRNGQDALVKLLLEKGAKLEAKDSNGKTPLLLAAENGHDVIVIPLLEKGARLEVEDPSYGQTALSWAAKNGHKEVVTLLVNKGADLGARDFHGQTPLLLAAANGHDMLVKLLREEGAELEVEDVRDNNRQTQ